MSSKKPLEIDSFGEYIIHIKESGQKLKKYKAYCSSCLSSRGFQPKSKFYRVCLPCKMKTPEYRDKLKKAIKKVRSTDKSRAKTKRQMEELRKKLHSNPNYFTNLKIKNNLRSRVSHAIAGRCKYGSAIRDLGCSIEELRKYLEYQFQPGMSWDNYGEWEIDHISPLAIYNLSDHSEFKKACHYTNLQPLWKSDNRKKGAKYV